jgi:hypothetical protein
MMGHEYAHICAVAYIYRFILHFSTKVLFHAVVDASSLSYFHRPRNLTLLYNRDPPV